MQAAEKLEKASRVALYVRVSTEEQAEHGYSIEAQLDILRQHCKSNNKEIVAEYVDPGVSGKEMTKRAKLQKLLRDAELGRFDEVMVWKFNRMSRKMYDLMKIVSHLDKHKVSFRSCSENFDTATPMGRFSLHMMGAVGEFERNTIVDNVKLGMKQRARMGFRNGGACLGYCSVEDSGGTGKKRKTRLVVVPEEAVIIKKIFDLYAAGKGFRAIATQLNREGAKTKKGNFFAPDSVREILKNPIYAGTVRYNRYEGWSETRRRGKNDKPILTEGRHEAIISREQWEQVQEMFAKRSKASPRVHDSENLLTGLIRCPECGTPMVISRSHYRLKDGSKVALRYYSCGQFKGKGSTVCHANSVRADYAEAYVLERIPLVLHQPKLLTAIVKAVNQKRRGSGDALLGERAAIEENLAQIETKKRRILEVYEMEGLDREALAIRLDTLAAEARNLCTRRAEIDSEMEEDTGQEVTVATVRQFLEQFNRVLQAASPEQKKTLLHLVIREITIHADKTIDQIVLHFDPDSEAGKDPLANAKANGSLLHFGANRKRGPKWRIAI
ncbi:recombinase family protein [Sporomusa sphaeroides]|uniref:DNA-invertase hin n=1 Tax=Sporomusa sphaeroides DSM 2875 TaxID=1337886 RepID=A0ABM9W6K7_9FIRM|nr:recombinase family protein [Sporomusa sphaeroides]OLS54432.1 DNA-invertase hin [Sporomusa sphaeroides DSM 2875]CVK20675.1 DNA-invertase hin [Sporomusa sphaeroides DSM 2875]